MAFLHPDYCMCQSALQILLWCDLTGFSSFCGWLVFPPLYMLTASRAPRLLPAKLQGGDLPLSSAVQCLTFKHGPLQQRVLEQKDSKGKSHASWCKLMKLKKGRPTDLNLKRKAKQTNKKTSRGYYEKIVGTCSNGEFSDVTAKHIIPERKIRLWQNSFICQTTLSRGWKWAIDYM